MIVFAFIQPRLYTVSMIDKNEFLKIMEYLEEQHKRDLALEKAVSIRFDNIVSLNENLNLGAFLMLAKETIDPDEFVN